MLYLNYTSERVSNELVTYGLSPLTADAHYINRYLSCNVPFSECTEEDKQCMSIQPSWSLNALIKNLPVIDHHAAEIHCTGRGTYFVRYTMEPNDSTYIKYETPCKRTLLGAIVEMYKILHNFGEI